MDIGDTVYFFGSNGKYAESLFYTKIETLLIGNPEIIKYPLINSRYNLDACFPSPQEAIDDKRRWLAELERNPDKMMVKAL
jgi:hypothetical protein